MINFVLGFLITYVISFFLIEWAGEGIATDPKTMIAVNLVILFVSVLSGVIAYERYKAQAARAEWLRRVHEFTQAGR